MSSKLPAVITECDEYETLTKDDRDSLVRRIKKSGELGASLSSGARREESPSFFQFVEGLELDASYLQEFDSPRGGSLSRWLIHYSWTFHTSPGAMRNALSPELVQQLDAAGPLIDAALESYEDWFKRLGLALVTASNAVLIGTTYESAMSHLVALDLFLNQLLAACYKLRLNRLVPR